MLPAAVITASLLLAQVTGAIAIVAPVIGNIGIIVGGIDKTVTTAIDLRKVLAPPKKPAKLAKHIARNRK